MAVTVKLKKNALETFMKAYNLDHQKLASHLGFSRPFISLIANEKKRPSANFIGALLFFSGLPFEYFFELSVTENDKNQKNPGKNLRKVKAA